MELSIRGPIMKSYLIAFTFLFINLIAFSQTDEKIEWLLKRPRNSIEKLNIIESNTISYVPSFFAEDALNIQTFYGHLNEIAVLRIYYVYTQYKSDPKFDQLNLDRKRFTLFKKHFPSFFNNPYLEWKIIEQTGANSPESGATYFHGFVVIHQPENTREERLHEISTLRHFMDDPTSEFPSQEIDPIASQIKLTDSNSTETIKKDSITIATYKWGNKDLQDHFKDSLHSDYIFFRRIDKWVDVKFEVNQEGSVKQIEFLDKYPQEVKDLISNFLIADHNWIPATNNGDTISSSVNLQIRVSYSPLVNGLYTRDHKTPRFEKDPDEDSGIGAIYEGREEKINHLQKSSTYQNLELLLDLQNAAVVMDVTGSMSSNIAAVLLWIHKHHHQSPFTSFTFFNDGDGMQSDKKKIGSTGGIYLTNLLEKMNGVLMDCMENGKGGDVPENDIESLIYAQENDLKSEALVLVGDNFSEIRDLELIENISKPVYVILCGDFGAPRADYLSVAKETQGKLFWRGSEIDLSKHKKGDVFSIGDTKYKYTGSIYKVK